MAIREMINRRPMVSVAITGIAIVAAVITVILWDHSEQVDKPAQVYFTTDDGKSYFPDDAAKIPPFDKRGQEAVLCYVFRCEGQRFVGYLMKYPKEVRLEIQAYQSAGREYPGVPPAALVKKPGDKTWVTVGSATGATLMQMRCPGKPDQFAEMVFP